jgi:hypothetical protein
MRNTFRVFALVLILSSAGRVCAQVADPAPTPVLAYVGRLIESGKLVTGSRPFVFSRDATCRSGAGHRRAEETKIGSIRPTICNPAMGAASVLPGSVPANKTGPG